MINWRRQALGNPFRIGTMTAPLLTFSAPSLLAGELWTPLLEKLSGQTQSQTEKSKSRQTPSEQSKPQRKAPQD
jgi:hypothetical protein